MVFAVGAGVRLPVRWLNNNDMAGWIKLRRDIADSWLWSDAEKMRWYIDLVMLAADKDKDKVIKGEVGHTLSSLAKRWKSNKMTVSRFLHRLDEDDMIILRESPYMLQGVLQHVLRIFVRDFSELRETMLQRVLQQVLHPPKEEIPPIPPKEENIFKEQEKERGSVDNNINIITTSPPKKSGGLSQKEENVETERYVKFRGWIEKNAPWCYVHLRMINEVQFYTLLQTYTPEQVSDIILDIENYAKRDSYKDLYLTARNWLKKRYGAVI